MLSSSERPQIRGFLHTSAMVSYDPFVYLSDELLAEVFLWVEDHTDQRNVSLVCKRWLFVQRHAKTKLGLCIPSNFKCYSSNSSAFSLLEQHPYLSRLSIVSNFSSLSRELVGVLVKAIATGCKSLRQLDFTAGEIAISGLQELSMGCPHLTAMKILQPPASCLHVLSGFSALRELSLTGCLEDPPHDMHGAQFRLLQLERLSLLEMRPFSCHLKWLWDGCSGLKKLVLVDCQQGGDMGMSLLPCFQSLQEVQLKRCRSIAGGVLMLISEHCPRLKSLTIHDGGDAEGLRSVLRRCETLDTLNLRLPLDLSNKDLMEMARSRLSLRSLCLHSCWLATGAGLQIMASSIRSSLEELVLVRCRAVVQDSGTLLGLGQCLPSLKKLDLSDNECLDDKELAAMLVSCQHLTELKIWRCSLLTDSLVDFICERCVMLENIDIQNCDGISTNALCSLLTRCGRLKRVGVEQSKLSNLAKQLASKKGIALVSSCHSAKTD